ncbi:SAM-dependent methyltransferase [Arthrobacter cupressi]|uniref:Methyltransferase domain-containing protein n=1 Tax=Arthrobacter cupressi TaxID=1045773 RepID=A0A1G8JT05_9MICC|nr:class I SAM-dependent methyltransferase [Arthrobacter cupressi]NYD77442.1 SAM-dependent methyltransferase [Arthrobacter cupressi]SDI34346.1 Methyltransferase domain-containing protein [Arthrobacter cupressi]
MDHSGDHDGGKHDGGARTFGEGAGSAEELWDDRYREQSRIWSGQPNPQLVAEAGSLVPDRAQDTALDLGCGEGADAIWLAQRGWRVTAVDVSAVALERAAGHAADSGVEERITFERRDLATWRPGAGYGLVSSQYLHSSLLDWRASAAMAARAVAPGGTLLLVGHFPHGQHSAREMFYTPEELAEALDGVLGTWTVHVLETRERTVTGPDGESRTLIDTVLRATRP